MVQPVYSRFSCCSRGRPSWSGHSSPASSGEMSLNVEFSSHCEIISGRLPECPYHISRESPSSCFSAVSELEEGRRCWKAPAFPSNILRWVWWWGESFEEEFGHKQGAKFICEYEWMYSVKSCSENWYNILSLLVISWHLPSKSWSYQFFRKIIIVVLWQIKCMEFHSIVPTLKCISYCQL